MRWIGKEMIFESLRELGDQKSQTRLWFRGNSNEQSSFMEAVESLYTDSGLGDELDKGRIVFSEEVDGKLTELRDVIQHIQSDTNGEAFVSSKEMSLIRDKANDILKRIEDEDGNDP